MEKKKKHRLSSIFSNLLMLIPNVIRLAFNITDLVGYEAQLAVKSMILVIMLAVVFACMLVTTWLCLLGLLFIYLSAHMSLLLSLLIVLLVNLVLLILIGLYFLKVKQRLLFPETRREIGYLAHLYKEL